MEFILVASHLFNCFEGLGIAGTGKVLKFFIGLQNL